MQIEIVAAFSDWFSKQQINLSLFLSNWCCRKLGVDGFPGPRKKSEVIQENDMSIISRSKGESRDYCSHFSVSLKTPSKFLIVFVRLVFGKKARRS